MLIMGNTGLHKRMELRFAAGANLTLCPSNQVSRGFASCRCPFPISPIFHSPRLPQQQTSTNLDNRPKSTCKALKIHVFLTGLDST